MNYKYTTVIFDMDGTVLNTVTDLMNALNHGLKKAELPLKNEDEVKRILGNGMRYMIEHAIPEGTSPEKQQIVFDGFKEFYYEHSNDNTKPYDGIVELMEELHRDGVRMAIVSNKPDKACQDLNEQYYKDITDLCMGEREGLKRKPAPDMVYEALRIMGCDKETAIYVGDSEVDYETAKNSGLPCISVTWGFRSKEHLISIGADKLADTPAEILHYL